MNRRTWISLMLAVLVVVGLMVWGFWPRPAPEIVLVWQGEPQFTKYSPGSAPKPQAPTPRP